MRKKSLVFTLILIGCFSLNIFAQDVDNQLWINYAVNIAINNKLRAGGDAGIRGLVSNQDWNQILLRPTVTYTINQTFSISGAAAIFSTFYQKDVNSHEFRLQQDLNITFGDLEIVDLFGRLRFEQRWYFFENLNDDFDLRMRYLIGVESMDFKLFGGKRPYYVQVMFEGFNTLDDNALEVFINKSRFHAAFGNRISRNFRYELHYILQTSRQFFESGVRNRQNIFRLRFFQTIERSKSDR